MIDEPEAELLVGVGLDLVDEVVVPGGLPRIGGLVHEGLDDDHLAGEPAALDRSGAGEAELGADDVRPLRVHRLAGDAELIPDREVGMDLVAVIGLEGQVDRVVDQDLVPGGDARQRRELGLALAGDDDVALGADDPEVVARRLAARHRQHRAHEAAVGKPVELQRDGDVGHRLGPEDADARVEPVLLRVVGHDRLDHGGLVLDARLERATPSGSAPR